MRGATGPLVALSKRRARWNIYLLRFSWFFEFFFVAVFSRALSAQRSGARRANLQHFELSYVKKKLY